VLILKKLILILLILIFFASFYTTAFAYSGECFAEHVILYQPDTETVIYENSAKEASLIASTTKILTALVVLENTSIDAVVEILPHYCGIEGSSMYLKPGERFTVKELLYGMILKSGNDAATALAYYTAGSIDEFADMMNSKAMEIGCINSNFTNPHGLDDEEHYSCAYDLALIMAEAIENKTFIEISGTKSISFAGREFTNHNKLLWNCEGVISGKTGYTKAAGRVLVSCSERDGMSLICVTINDGNDWKDHSTLYDWGFDNYSLIKSQSVFNVPVISGIKSEVRAISDEVKVLCDKDTSPEVKYYIPEFLYAPVTYGDVIGRVEIINGENVTVNYIYADETVDLDNSVPLTLWEQIKWSWYYYNKHSNYIPILH